MLDSSSINVYTLQTQRGVSEEASGQHLATQDPQRLKSTLKGLLKASIQMQARLIQMHQSSQHSWGTQMLNHCKDEDTTQGQASSKLLA